jgi:hypothetical protein
MPTHGPRRTLPSAPLKMVNEVTPEELRRRSGRGLNQGDRLNRFAVT